MSDTDPIPDLLRRTHEGDPAAANQLLELLYSDLHVRAKREMARQAADHTLQPTALVNEAYLRLTRKREEPWASRPHFLAVAAKAMRQTLIDHARARRALQREARGSRQSLEGIAIEYETRAFDLEALDQAMTDLAEFDPLMAQAVELRFFGGLTNAEAANCIDMSERTFDRRWKATKARLLVEVQRISGER